MPFTKYSVMIIDRILVSPVFDTTSTSSQLSPGRRPDIRQMSTETTSAGGFSHTGLSPLVASFMKSVHSGTARSPA